MFPSSHALGGRIHQPTSKQIFTLLPDTDTIIIQCNITGNSYN